MALELGFSLQQLAELTEAEFTTWGAYRARKMLRARRSELLLANVAMLIDVHMGGRKNAKLSDYLFDPKDETDDDDEEGD